MEVLTELALFAGAGGTILAGKLLGWRTVCAVEIDEYCQRVLLQRQQDGILEPFPIWDDAKSFDGRPWRGCVDIVTASPPCQPWSNANAKKQGDQDERNLWPDTIRIIREVRPRFVLVENVPAIAVHEYFRRILWLQTFASVGKLAVTNESQVDAVMDVINYMVLLDGLMGND